MTTTIDFKKMSLQDAFDLAILIEKEAEDRYQEFADRFGTMYEGDAGTFFETMVQNERKHGQSLQKKRTELFGNAASRVNSTMIWDIEAPNEGAPRAYLTVQQALQIALESETKAKNFFEEALKKVTDSQVKTLFQELAQEEVEHAEMIRSLMAKLPKDKGSAQFEDDIDEPQGLD